MACVVKNCKEHTKKHGESVTFHRFPVIECRKEMWMLALKLDPTKIGKVPVVCSKHFKSTDFVSYNSGRKRLFPSAVPHLAMSDELNITTQFSGSINVSMTELPEEYDEDQDFESPTLSKDSFGQVIKECDDKSDSLPFSTEIVDLDYIESVQEDEINGVVIREQPTVFVGSNFSLPFSTEVVDLDYMDDVAIRSGLSQNLIGSKHISIKEAMKPNEFFPIRTPKEAILKRKLAVLRQVATKRNQTINALRIKIRRQKKRIDTLSDIVKTTKERIILNDDTVDIWESIGNTNEKFFDKSLWKNQNLSLSLTDLEPISAADEDIDNSTDDEQSQPLTDAILQPVGSEEKQPKAQEMEVFRLSSNSFNKVFTSELIAQLEKYPALYRIIPGDRNAVKIARSKIYNHLKEKFPLEYFTELYVIKKLKHIKLAYEKAENGKIPSSDMPHYERLSFLRGKMRIQEEAIAVNELGRIVCTICCKDFESRCSLRRHMQIHQPEYRYKCEVCEKQFFRFTSFQTHVRIHTNEKPFLCELCGMSFNTQPNFGRHLQTHRNEKNFKCELCPKAYTRKQNLNDHMNIHLNIKPEMCEICGKGFTSKMSLSIHIESHDKSGESRLKNYKCELCPMAYYRRQNLKIHMNTHFNLKPEKCEICGKLCSTKTNLSMHMESHDKSGALKFKCKLCDKGFKRSSSRYSHMRLKHKERP